LEYRKHTTPIFLPVEKKWAACAPMVEMQQAVKLLHLSALDALFFRRAYWARLARANDRFFAITTVLGILHWRISAVWAGCA
jgi:hypothetical protein